MHTEMHTNSMLTFQIITYVILIFTMLSMIFIIGRIIYVYLRERHTMPLTITMHMASQNTSEILMT